MTEQSHSPTGDDVERVARALHAEMLDMEAEGDGCRWNELSEEQLAMLDSLARAAIATLSPNGVSRRQWRDDEPAPAPLACYDCGLPYASHAWIEAVVPHKIWNEHLSPRGNSGGILCINCMAARAVEKGLADIPCKLTAGPFVLSNGVSQSAVERLIDPSQPAYGCPDHLVYRADAIDKSCATCAALATQPASDTGLREALEPLKCSICETAVVWEHDSEHGSMVCSCNSTQWVRGEGMKPWEDGYENAVVHVRTILDDGGSKASQERTGK